jgi:DNA-binding NarL/FixJ family response regulator
MSPSLSPPAAGDRLRPAASRAAPGGRIRVLIADDHAAVRVGVRRLLAEQPDIQVVGEASSALEAVAATAAVDVGVIDYHLGDRNGLWVVRRLAPLRPRPRALLYSAFSDEPLAVSAIVAGADGLLPKSAVGDELCVAVRRLAGGERYLPTISPPATSAVGARLQPRQRSVLEMLIHGLAPAQIAARLRITIHELEAERAEILAIIAPPTNRGRRYRRPRTPLDYERRRRSLRFDSPPRAPAQAR